MNQPQKATKPKQQSGKRRIEKLMDEKDRDETAHKPATKKSYRISIIFYVGRRL